MQSSMGQPSHLTRYSKILSVESFLRPTARRLISANLLNHWRDRIANDLNLPHKALHIILVLIAILRDHLLLIPPNTIRANALILRCGLDELPGGTSLSAFRKPTLRDNTNQISIFCRNLGNPNYLAARHRR